ncbi:hypothetical protein P7K49_012254 [Saguinus oedipus]|uniref:Uncharacterized protein n=1 Tax=Saguinus oedipus TaxID=9490 RepID=A0ABQ9VWI8_SAGOE|nr:hypothetical protein P7K49_012254 [Saguinus oedipus]
MAVGTWDPFKTKPLGAGKLVPGKPQLGLAIRPREQPRLPASASAGPDATVERPRQRSPPTSIKMEGAAGSLGAGLPPVGGAGARPGSSLGAAVPQPGALALSRPVHRLPPSPGRQWLMEAPSTACSIVGHTRCGPLGERSQGQTAPGARGGRAPQAS